MDIRKKSCFEKSPVYTSHTRKSKHREKKKKKNHKKLEGPNTKHADQQRSDEEMACTKYFGRIRIHVNLTLSYTLSMATAIITKLYLVLYVRLVCRSEIYKLHPKKTQSGSLRKVEYVPGAGSA